MQMLIGVAPLGLQRRHMGSRVVIYASEPDAAGNRPTISDKLPGYNLYSVVNTEGDPTRQIGGGASAAPSLALTPQLPDARAKQHPLAQELANLTF